MKTFEERLTRLEAISETLRNEETGLEQAAELFAEGVKLAKDLEKELTRAERRVEQLLNEPDQAGDKPVLELFPELAGDNGGTAGTEGRD